MGIVKLDRIKAVLAESREAGKMASQQLGKDPTTVSKWCTNTIQPDLKTLSGEDVDAIGKSVAYLFGEDCFIVGDLIIMKHFQNPKFLGYALDSTISQKQKSYGKIKTKGRSYIGERPKECCCCNPTARWAA